MNKERIKVYTYKRVSTAMQIDGYSLDAQRSRMKAYADFNDYEKMTLSFQVYIFNEMRRYIKDELAKKEAGEEYDEDIIDKVTGEPITFPSE